MATDTKKDSKQDVVPVTGLLADMEIEESVTIPMRGRGYDSDVVGIRAQLEACLTDGTARSFKNVSEEKREEYARKIRSAGKMKGKPEIKVGTRYDKANSKLIWGPAEVLDTLSGKKAS